MFTDSTPLGPQNSLAREMGYSMMRLVRNLLKLHVRKMVSSVRSCLLEPDLALAGKRLILLLPSSRFFLLTKDLGHDTSIEALAFVSD